MTFDEFLAAAKTAQAEYDVAHEEVLALSKALDLAREREATADKASREMRWAIQALRDAGVVV